MVNEPSNEIERESEWKYFAKNISEISFISTAWSGTSEVEWQVECVIIYILKSFNIITGIGLNYYK